MRLSNIFGDQRNFHPQRRCRLIRPDVTTWQIGCTKLMGRKGQRWRGKKLVQPQEEKGSKIFRLL